MFPFHTVLISLKSDVIYNDKSSRRNNESAVRLRRKASIINW